MTGMAHLAGGPIVYGSLIRQRCKWCGAALIDVDLATINVAIPTDAGPD